MVAFFKVRSRYLYVKSASEIMANQSILKGFDPIDAAKIGVYSAKAHYDRLSKNRNMHV